MIRPVLGKKLKDNPILKDGNVDYFLVSPNPSSDGNLWIRFMSQQKGETKAVEILPDEDITNKLEIEVYNIVGQKVYNSLYKPQINVAFLEPGVYLIRLIDMHNNNSMVQKLIISR
jgi:hypothetical protein